jgi:hypothetical protein
VQLQLLESQAAPTQQAPEGSKAPTDEVELLMQVSPRTLLGGVLFFICS